VNKTNKPERTLVTPATLKRLAKTAGRHPVKDAKGLKLKVLDAARSYWTVRFRFEGRETELSLGTYDKMTLERALEAHAEIQLKLRKQIDPQDGKKARHAPRARGGGAPTFDEAARKYIENNESDWRSAKHRQQWSATLGCGAADRDTKRRTGVSLPPWFRDMRTDQIGSEHVLAVLDPVWKKKPETAARLRARIEKVLDSSRGPKDMHPNPAALSGWLKTQLGRKKTSLDPVTGDRAHHLALPFDRIPALMAALKDRETTAARALELLILTAARTTETLGLPWKEIEREYKVAAVVDGRPGSWTFPAIVIPARRMKMYRRHRAPLSDPALAIIEAQLKKHGDSDPNAYVFPGARPKRPLGPNALVGELKSVGFAGATTVHGLRASFRSWCKSIGVAPETAEEALAHATGDKTARAYDRDDQLVLRIPLMEAWGRYCVSAIDAEAPLMLPPATSEA
jgi:integrase